MVALFLSTKPLIISLYLVFSTKVQRELAAYTEIRGPACEALSPVVGRTQFEQKLLPRTCFFKCFVSCWNERILTALNCRYYFRIPTSLVVLRSSATLDGVTGLQWIKCRVFCIFFCSRQQSANRNGTWVWIDNCILRRSACQVITKDAIHWRTFFTRTPSIVKPSAIAARNHSLQDQ